MEGEVIFESTKGVGSTFGFRIPVQLCQEKSLAPAIMETNLPIHYQGKVLIAEDNEMNIILMETLMEDLDVSFEIVTDGERAVQAVREGDYALVLMDNQMPKLSGMEATQQIRKFNTKIPIVALFANAFKSEQQQFLEAGMNESLAKPIDFDKLKSVLNRYL